MRSVTSPGTPCLVNNPTERPDNLWGTPHLQPIGSNRFVTWPGGSENGGVHAAALRFDLHVPASRSLKAKRAAVRPIIDTLRHRYHVSVAEVDHQDRWQRAAIAVAVGAERNPHPPQGLDTLRRVGRPPPPPEGMHPTAPHPGPR